MQTGIGFVPLEWIGAILVGIFLVIGRILYHEIGQLEKAAKFRTRVRHEEELRAAAESFNSAEQDLPTVPPQDLPK